MKNIAIISFFHPESSLCLTKYLAQQSSCVDYYYVANLLHDKKAISGFEYPNAKRTLGNHLLSKEEVPEMYAYMDGLPVRLFLTRIIHHERYPKFHYWLMKALMWQIKLRHYDAINIVGQASWVNEAHNSLKGENLIHTFHELGNHAGELHPLQIVKSAIADKTKVILHSKATYDRFLSIPGADVTRTTMIPFGKFETTKLYVQEQDVPLPFTNNKPILLFYGYIAPYKGLDVLAKSIEILKSDWDKFNIIVAGAGEDPNLSFFKSLPNGFVLNKFLSNDEMMNLIRQSSAILLPYRTASQTGIIPTCTLYGKPFIATNVGAFSESVVNGYNGMLVEPENPDAFASAIKNVIDNPELLVRLSIGASNFGNGDQYDWNTIAKQTIEFVCSGIR